MWVDGIETVSGDEQVVYDENGNPISIDDLIFNWTNGRSLSSLQYEDENGQLQTLLSYKYDENGIRVSKTYGDVTTYYVTDNGYITAQYQLDESGNICELMRFIYDSANTLLGFTYNGQTYFYLKNLQGDITNIVDTAGNIVGTYEYSAFGECYVDYSADNDIAYTNPMRYRDYYLDDEMSWYYLQSRYYVPTWGRFLNSDLPKYAQEQKDSYVGLNLFAYCCNDPVNCVDPTGCWTAAIHYGKDHKKGKKYDGTYEWLTLKKYEIRLYRRFARAIAEGNQYVDENPDTTPLPSIESDIPLASRQRYHFNRNPRYQTDSRLEEGMRLYVNAVKKYNKSVINYRKTLRNLSRTSKTYKADRARAKKTLKIGIIRSMKLLGAAMHCYQDIYAHGSITAGPVDIYHPDRIKGHANIQNVDNPYYKWTDDTKTGVTKNKVYGKLFLSKRYYDTKDKTIEVFLKFKGEIKFSKYLKKSFWG